MLTSDSLTSTPLPRSTYHRRIVAIPEDGRVRAALEDESHHIEITVFHANNVITDIQTKVHRLPWTTCPGAAAKLKELVGLSLRRMHESTGRDAKENCTHMFDLARVAIARGCIGKPVQYDMELPDRVEKRTRAKLYRDGELALWWDAEGSFVTGPEPFTGHTVRGAPKWPEGLDDDTLEAALVLRRVFLVASTREPGVPDIARMRSGPEVSIAQITKREVVLGRCFSFQAPHVDEGKMAYTWRNSADRQEDLLSGFPGTRSLAEMKRAKAAR